MKCAKVICVWMGTKRGANNNCPTVDIIDESIDLEINLDKGYPTDTYFVVNESGDELDNYLDKYNNTETFNGVIKVVKRPNLGLSFAAYLETYYRLKSEYDYWFFCEDDVIVFRENYIKMFIENLKGDTSFVALAPISDKGGQHCGGGCGLTSTHFMNEAYPYYELICTLHKWCAHSGQDAAKFEVEFTNRFKLSNCKDVSPLASNWNLHSSQTDHSNDKLKSSYIYKVGKGLGIMKDYFSDKNALDIPFIESPFFNKIIDHNSYLTFSEKDSLIEYNKNGYIVIDLELEDEFIDDLLEGVHSELDSLNTQDNRYHYSDSPRVFEAWKTIPNVLSLARHPKIINTLRLLYGRNPIPFQTINFLKGSNQPLHQDSIHFYTEPQRWMVGTWTSLQNMTEDCGPLTIVPGSHKWPHYNFQNLNLPVVGYGNQFDNYAEYENFLVQLLESMGGERKEWLGLKGQCIIWASNLLHGGAPITNPDSTRYAQATHFYFEGCKHYYSPMFSNVSNGKYSEKDLTQKDILGHEI